MDNLPLTPLPRREITVVLGMTGSGKSSWIKQRIKNDPYVLMFDFVGDVVPGEAVVIQDFDALCAYFEHPLPRFRVAFQPINDQEIFPAVCVLVRELGKAYGKITFCVDEVDRYSLPAFDPPEFRELIARGRHYGVSLYCATVYPPGLSRLLRSQAVRFVLFRLEEPAHLDYLAERIGERAYSCRDLPFFTPVVIEPGAPLTAPIEQAS